MALLHEQTARMAREKRALDSLAAENAGICMGGWHEADGLLRVAVTFRVLGTDYSGYLVYPGLFPDVPAYVIPANKDECWSGHQYVNGTLCLEYGPDTWRADLMGADVIKSAYTLLLTEGLQKHLPYIEPVKSRHVESVGRQLLCSNQRFVVTPALRALTPRLSTKPTGIKLAVSKLGQKTVTCVCEVADLGRIDDSPPLGIAGLTERPGLLVKVDDLSRARSSAVALAADLNAVGPGIEPEVLVFVDGSGHWLAIEVCGDTVMQLDTVSSNTERADRLPTGFTAFKERHVAVVGLGSLGSKVAVSLARCGVGKFTLVDDDVLLPENLVRNDLDWRAVGFDKVSGARDRILSVNPTATVFGMPLQVAGQENPKAHAALLDVMSAANLVIDATAAANAFVVIAAICKRRRVPLIWGEVFAGGIGALMARSRPGVEPEPLSIRGSILAALAQLPEAPFKAGAFDYGTGEAAPIVATDADAGQLAAAISQLALDTLTPAASAYSHPAYLLGFKKAWVFKEAMEVIPINPSAGPGTTEEGPTSDDVRVIDELVAMCAAHNAENHGTA